MESDLEAHFSTILADEIEDIGYRGVIKRIMERVGTNPVYLTIDIDTIDPAFAVSSCIICLRRLLQTHSGSLYSLPRELRRSVSPICSA